MERVRFERRVRTVLRLTREEVEILTTAAEAHYDGAVRGLSIPGEGATLNTARNSLRFGDEEGGKKWVEIEVDNHQLGLLAKATEIHAPYAHMPGADLNFTMWFNELLRDATAEWFHLNPQHHEEMNVNRRSNGAEPREMPERPAERRTELFKTR
jgi:hypothetical protein